MGEDISKLKDHDTDIVLATVHLRVLDQSGGHGVGLVQGLAQLHCLLVLADIPQPVGGNHQEVGLVCYLELLDVRNVRNSLRLQLEVAQRPAHRQRP
jgi:hypothetical protein